MGCPRDAEMVLQAEAIFPVHRNIRSETSEWLESLQTYRSWRYSHELAGLKLTKEVLSVPGFDFQAAAIMELTRRYQPILQVMHDNRIFLRGERGRIEKLAAEFHGKTVFDPTVLRPHYERTRVMAEFICSNYAPISRFIKEHAPLSSLKNPKYLMAFAALLLFVSDWDLDVAEGRLAQIATSFVGWMRVWATSWG